MIIQLSCTALLACVTRAQGAEPVALDRVIAVEEADSTFGRYRFVFSVTAPLPAPSDASFGPRFWLGESPLRFPGHPRDRTVLFGYVSELPEGFVPLRMTSGWPADDDQIQAGEIVIQPAALLQRSRLEPGEFEPAHVQRSVGRLVDLGAALSSSDVVFVGRFVRGEVNIERLDLWELTFDREAILWSRSRVEVPARVLFLETIPHYLELGAPYVLFANTTPTGEIDPERLAAVRVWQPRGDFVLGYLEGRTAQGDLDRLDAAGLARARSFLFEALESPAAEVRLAAANELRSRSEGSFAPTPEEAARLRQRAAVEPRDEVQRALLALAEEKSVDRR